MWVKVDDAFPNHPKVHAATARLGGKYAYGRVIAMAMQGKCYAAANLTDGFLPAAAVRNFQDPDPMEVAAILVKVVLWEKVVGGYRVHDYHDYNPSAAELKAKRRDDRERQRQHRKERETSKQTALSQGLSQRDTSVTDPNLSHGLSHVNPKRSRARDPVPVRLKEQERTSIGAGAPSFPQDTEPTHALLCRLVYQELKDSPQSTEADVVEALKAQCGQLGMDYGTGEGIRRAINSVEQARKRPA